MSLHVRIILTFVLGILGWPWSARGLAGPTIPPPGIREHTPRVHALQNARIVTEPGRVIDRGTVVIRDGNIIAVGEELSPPQDARLWDLTGKTIYAGFIDLYSNLGMPHPNASPRGRESRTGSTASDPQGSPYWSPHITPEQTAVRLFTHDAEAAAGLRGQGITLVLALPPGKIMRGTGALVLTGDGPANDLVVAGEVALGIRFESSGWGSDEYPGSLMGVLALLRQSFLDADWYGRAHVAWSPRASWSRPEHNQSLERLRELMTRRVPLVMEAANEKAFLRSASLARELGLPAIIRGSNFEYRRLSAIKATALPVILPLDFPDAPAVGTPEDALEVNLNQLRHWHLAPECARYLHAEGVAIAFTADGLKDPGVFLSSVRKAVKRGLPADAALAALTATPAELLGRSDRYGSIAPGKAANLVVTDGDLFADGTELLDTWVEGHRYTVAPQPEVDFRGSWKVSLDVPGIDTDELDLTLEGKPSKLKGSIVKDSKAKLRDVELVGARLSFAFVGDSLGYPGVVQVSCGLTADRLNGYGVLHDGRRFQWRASRFEPDADTADTTTQAGEKSLADEPQLSLELTLRYPDGAFGWIEPPSGAGVTAFTHATIWTSGPLGVLTDATLLIADGKVVGVGNRINVPGDARVVDATGLHITPGLIDCHSHTAIDGDVNESQQTISAEVRIGDVVDPDDIALYRELAGGLTVANLLHGSANAIGGQNQVIKLRWGGTAEELKFEGAPPGIKFALGENPKQSNWGDRFTSRYPQTRMGVEQIIRDAFQAAREYQAAWESYSPSQKDNMPLRRDLELEAVAEVLAGKRLVHAHSYRQDEILMLMRLAEAYDFRIATFQHILEGYKVADRMAAHGAGGSAFSDWWAYKFEVYDAIPYNGALMHDQGVVVSFNSDSNELARRLNTEAAKAVKYGGVNPAEALKFVTLNPALQLGIDHRVGSLEPGKDADFAVWSGDPLSTYSRCEQTWIDGRKYFDREDDARLREEVQKERALLIQAALKEGDGDSGGGGGAPPWGRKPRYSCKGLIEEGHSHDDF